MPADLAITQARLMGKPGLWTIAMGDRAITAVTPEPVAATHTLNAQGQLVIPGLVDAHIHLDKALLLAQAPAQVGDFAEAMRETLRLKQRYTVADIQHRARQVLDAAIAFGITAMRTHVEVDPIVGLTALEALLPLKADYAWGIDLQLAIFAQEGITNQPGTEALLRKALSLGGDVIGSAPYVDPDPQRNIEIVFDLAAEFDCDVDFHLDFLDDDRPLQLPWVLRATEMRGWQGRVCLGHMTKLAALPPEALHDIGTQLAALGISVLALPASDLYMMARRDTHNVRRGVAPLQRLIAAGANGAIATNNVQNLFTPFGDGDVLKIATLIAQVLQLGTETDHALCLEMASTRAAAAIGIPNYRVEVGGAADLVILGTSSPTGAIAAAPPTRTVIKGGRCIARTAVQTQWVGRAEG